MARPWEILERVARPEGELALKRRGERDFLITLGPRVLMTSVATESESVLAERACAGLADAPSPRLLIGGLGMGYTLRAALDALPRRAAVCVAELEPAVVAWCRGPIAHLTGGAIADPRVVVRESDVATVIAEAAADPQCRYDAIALDLFEGPHGTKRETRHPLYGDAALAAAHRALRPDGVLAIWSETPAAGFDRRLAAAGFRIRRWRAGRGGRRHVVYEACR